MSFIVLSQCTSDFAVQQMWQYVAQTWTEFRQTVVDEVIKLV